MKARREAEDPKTLTSTLPLVKAEYYMNIMIVWDNATMEKMLLLAIFDQRLQMQRQSYQNGLREQEQFPNALGGLPVDEACTRLGIGS